MLFIFENKTGNLGEIESRSCFKSDQLGPIFIYEPPYKIDFLNTLGAVIDCSAHGVPDPQITWYHSGKVVSAFPELLLLPTNGSLIFAPFTNDNYKQDIHAGVYICHASNMHGKIVSRPVNVRAVVSQSYEAQVYDEYVIKGNTAVFTCNIPSFVTDYVVVTSWVREDSFTIRADESTGYFYFSSFPYGGRMSGKKLRKCSSKRLSLVEVFFTKMSAAENEYLIIYSFEILAGSRYSFLSGGKLHIRNVMNTDNNQAFWCRTRHLLNGFTHRSASSGRLYVTDSESSIAPRFTHSEMQVVAKKDENVELGCAAQGHPIPNYTLNTENGPKKHPVAINQWNKLKDDASSLRGISLVKHERKDFRFDSEMTQMKLDEAGAWCKEKKKGADWQPVKVGRRVLQLSGSLIINKAKITDSGVYVCYVNNTVGATNTKTTLTITEPLTVFIDPQRQVVDVGKSATLNCSVTGNPQGFVEWKKDGKSVHLRRRSQTSTSSASFNDSSLFIKRVHRSDKGMYQCFVTNSYEVKQGTAQILLGDVSPILTRTFSNKVLQPGPVVSLTCVTSGNPKPFIKWNLDGQVLKESSKFRIHEYMTKDGSISNTLNVTNVQSKDGGLYTCIALNKVGEKRYTGKLHVYGLPLVKEMLNRTVVAGENFLLHCYTSGYPIKSIYWFRDNYAIASGTKYEIFNNGSIIVKKADKISDSGRYTCTAIKPQIAPLSLPPKPKERSTIRIFCSVVAGDPPFTIKWFKDGKSLSLHLGIIEKKEDAYSSIEIQSLSTFHSGNYTCSVRNFGGTSSATASLNVEAPPFWKKPPTSKIAGQFQDVRMDCSVGGYPLPVVTWAKLLEGRVKQKIEKVDKRYYIHSNGTLLVKNVSGDEIGSYLCEASNDVEPSLSKEIQLTMGTPPVVELPATLKTINKGHNLSIPCYVRGLNISKIVWKKTTSSQTIELRSKKRITIKKNLGPVSITSTLLIVNVMKRDNGVYTCTTSNTFGQAEKSVKVIIQEPPDSAYNITLFKYQNKTLQLGWMPPKSDGNSPLTGYELQYKPVTAFPRASIKDLEPGVTFEIKVVSANMLGRGRASDVISFMPTLNGTLIIHQSSREDVSDASLQPLIIIIIPAVAVFFLVIILIVIIVLFKKRKDQEQTPVKHDEYMKKLDTINPCTAQSSDQDQYGYGKLSADDNTLNRNYMNLSRYSTTYNNSSHCKIVYYWYRLVVKPNKTKYSILSIKRESPLAASVVTPRYDDVSISPYATFKLPDRENVEQLGPTLTSHMELKTFTPSKTVSSAL
ncbi:Down syndrome cell adhesion molecule [Nymphon striatum]|nr:Down syndrome cell adhesion molecule [Nymphon striatum]